MDPYYSQYEMKSLRQQLKAWESHIERNRLEDRIRFVQWLCQLFTSRELALIIDCEADRKSIWKTYLCERYGP